MRDRRGGHTSGDPYGELPRVSDRPAAGAQTGGITPGYVPRSPTQWNNTCGECGAVVHQVELHSAWHARLALNLADG